MIPTWMIIAGCCAIAILCGVLVPKQPQSMIVTAAGSVLWIVTLFVMSGKVR